MIWTDAPYGVGDDEKTAYNNRQGYGRSRRPIKNDSLPPDELQKLFAAALEIAREHAMPGAVIYATVPSVFLKYFIQGLGDGGFAYHHCLIWVKQTFVLGAAITITSTNRFCTVGWKIVRIISSTIGRKAQYLRSTVRCRAPITRPASQSR